MKKNNSHSKEIIIIHNEIGNEIVEEDIKNALELFLTMEYKLKQVYD